MKHFHADPGITVIFPLLRLFNFDLHLNANAKTVVVLQAKLLKGITNFPDITEEKFQLNHHFDYYIKCLRFAVRRIHY